MGLGQEHAAGARREHVVHSTCRDFGWSQAHRGRSGSHAAAVAAQEAAEGETFEDHAVGQAVGRVLQPVAASVERAGVGRTREGGDRSGRSGGHAAPEHSRAVLVHPQRRSRRPPAPPAPAVATDLFTAVVARRTGFRGAGAECADQSETRLGVVGHDRPDRSRSAAHGLELPVRQSFGLPAGRAVRRAGRQQRLRCRHTDPLFATRTTPPVRATSTWCSTTSRRW